MGLFGTPARQGRAGPASPRGRPRDQREAQLESTGTWFDQRPDTVS